MMSIVDFQTFSTGEKVVSEASKKQHPLLVNGGHVWTNAWLFAQWEGTLWSRRAGSYLDGCLVVYTLFKLLHIL